jgi:copper(I)-binding protein
MSVTDGIMRMRALDQGIEIPAGGKIEFKPGGYHIMFIGLKQQALGAGQRFGDRLVRLARR